MLGDMFFMKKIKIFMIVIVMIALLLIIYLFSDTKRINKLILDSYITGTVMEDPIEPLYKFKNENDIMSTNKDAWDRIIILDEHNTIGFIDDFYCADIFKSPRRISRGIEEKIRVVIPQKGENYADSIDKVIDQEKYTHYSPNEKVILENEYYGGNEYYEQQRIRMLRKHENFFLPIRICLLIEY